MHTIQNLSIQSNNKLKTWTISVQSRPAVCKDDEVPGMKMNIGIPTDIPNCMIIQEIQQLMAKDDNLQQLREHIIRGWPQNRNEIPQEIRSYWTFRDDMALIDDIILKGR